MSEIAELRLRAASDTDVGQVRSINEDTAYSWVSHSPAVGPLGLLIVADGIGGFRLGDIASSIAAEQVSDYLQPFIEEQLSLSLVQRETIEQNLEQAVQHANTQVFTFSKQEQTGVGHMGTTITCMLIQGDQAILANVGDSRIYRYRDAGLELLTKDHTLAGELVEDGHLDPDAIVDHPRRNILTRALGLQADIQVDITSVTLQAGERFLLCSDGLWSMTQDTELEQALGVPKTPVEVVENLIANANDHGGKDNISVVVCDVSRARPD